MKSLIVLVVATTTMACVTAAPAAANQGHAGHHGHDWNEVYRRGTGFSPEANALLKTTAASVKPGTALDVGMGQGRNALYLARQGWQVTGFDTAEEGVRMAKEVAQAEHLRLDAVVADIETYDFGEAKYDLVALMYVGGADCASRVIRALKPGGLVVVEFFRFDETAGHNVPGSFKVGELEALFAGFEVLKSEAVDDVADWSLKPQKLMRFVARKRGT